MTMKFGMPSAIRSFDKKFLSARSTSASSSSSKIGMSDAAAAAEPEEEEKKSFLKKVCQFLFIRLNIIAHRIYASCVVMYWVFAR